VGNPTLRAAVTVGLRRRAIVTGCLLVRVLAGGLVLLGLESVERLRVEISRLA
jgi:hypothetical protein